MVVTMDEIQEFTADELAACYIALRDKKSEIEEVKKKINESMDVIEARMLEILTDAGADSIATASGTFFKKEKVTYTATDWDAFWEFASAQPKGVFLTKTPRKESVDAYLEQYGELPPGLSARSEITINVRRK